MQGAIGGEEGRRTTLSALPSSPCGYYFCLIFLCEILFMSVSGFIDRGARRIRTHDINFKGTCDFRCT